MTDEQREQFYWRFCLILLALSPATLFVLHTDHLAPGLPTMLAVVGVPIAIVMDAIFSVLRGESLLGRFWVANMTGRSAFKSIESLEENLDRITQRLEKLGFTVTADSNCTQLVFSKNKKTPAQSTLDCAFSGRAILEPSEEALWIAAEVVLGDIILFDNGERKTMQALADFVSGKSDAFVFRKLHFMALYSLNLGLLITIAAYAAHFKLGLGEGLVLNFSAVAVGLGIMSASSIRHDAQHLMGFRVAIAATVLGALPYIAVLIP